MTHYPWRRLTYIVGTRLERDFAGWVLADQPAIVPGVFSAAPLSDCRDTAAIVLTGERGMGKSTALFDERQELHAAGADCVFVDLGAVVGTEDAQRQLSDALICDAGDSVRYVFLDRLDRGLDLVPPLLEVLTRSLRATAMDVRKRIRIRLACRTHLLPVDVYEALKEVFKGVEHRVLAELTREDVAAAANCESVDAAAFLTAIESQRLLPLAGIPITLLPLLHAARDGYPLPQSAYKAYQDGCRALCAEPRRSSGAAARDEPGPEGLLAAARRIAGFLQFGSLESIITDPVVLAGPRELALTSIEGGHEPDDLSERPCTARELHRVMESALFTPVAAGRVGFAHHSFQEFLAAEYLRLHRVALPALTGLLFIGSGRARHVVVAHREVAGWLAGSHDDLFDALLADDPAVLLPADLSARRTSDRGRIVKALLDRAAVLGADSYAPHEFRNVNHPGLADQLRPHLSMSADDEVRDLAMTITSGCNVVELTSHLIDVAEAPEVISFGRRKALYSLPQPIDTAMTDRLIRITTDQDPHVAGFALQALAHLHLDRDIALRILADTTADLQYATSLVHELSTRLTEADIPTVLDWCTAAVQLGRQTPTAVALDLAYRAIRTMEQTDPAVVVGGDAVARLAAFAVAVARLHHSTGHPNVFDLVHTFGGTPEVRHTTLEHILEVGSADDAALGGWDLDLYHPDEPDYWEHRFPILSERAQATFRTALGSPPRPADKDRAPHPDPEPTSTIGHRHSRDPSDVDSSSAVQKQGPQSGGDHRERPGSDDVPANSTAMMLATLPDAAGPLRAAWAHVVGQVLASASAPDNPLNPAAVSSAAGDAATGARLRATALTVLTSVPIITADTIGEQGTFVDDVAEAWTIALIDDQDLDRNADMTPARWAGLAAGLFALGVLGSADGLEPSHDTVRAAILPRCVRRAGPELHTLLPALLDRLVPMVLPSVLDVALPHLDDHGKAVVLEWAAAPNRDVERWRLTTDRLARDQHSATIEHLTAIISAGYPSVPTETAGNSDVDRWASAPEILLNAGSRHIATVWPMLVAHSEVLDRMIGRVAQGNTGFLNAVQLYAQVEQIGWMYEYLARRFPAAQSPAESVRPAPLWSPQHLRDRLAFAIAARKTPEASNELERLAKAYPDAQIFRVLWRTHIRAVAELAHQPVDPTALTQLVADSRRRVVDDSEHLLAVVLESCDRLQRVLTGSNGMAPLLWNRSSQKGEDGWWPSWEEDLSDLVAAFLRLDIEHGVIINREVEFRRPTLNGQRLDIIVEATTDDPSAGPARVIIECKGCWNKYVGTDMKNQLVRRYLQDPGRPCGIYLVGFFDCDRWDRVNHQRPHRPHGIEKERKRYRDQAAVQAQFCGVSVRSVILDCRLTANPFTDVGDGSSATLVTAAVSKEAVPRPRAKVKSPKAKKAAT